MAIYATERRLHRAHEGAYVGGVCAGLADYYECDAIVVRILAVLLAILTAGIACIVYLVMWARVPLAANSEAPYDVRPESAESNAFGCVDCDPYCEPDDEEGIPLLARLAIAAGLAVLFLTVAMGVSLIVPGTHWWQFWPVALLMTGLCFIVIPVSRREAIWHAAGIAITAVAASLLPMSLGIISWGTIFYSFERLWPLFLLVIVLFIMGIYNENDALLLASAFCFVVFCLVGITFCVIPGELESLFFYGPTGHHINLVPPR